MDESINQLNNRFAQLDEDIVHARELVTNIRERLTQQEEEQDLPGKPLVQPPEQRQWAGHDKVEAAGPADFWSEEEKKQLSRFKEQLKDRKFLAARRQAICGAREKGRERMIDNVMKMNIEEFRQQVKELSVEQHLLLSGWVYGFTDQAHKKIHDLLADEKAAAG